MKSKPEKQLFDATLKRAKEAVERGRAIDLRTFIDFRERDGSPWWLRASDLRTYLEDNAAEFRLKGIGILPLPTGQVYFYNSRGPEGSSTKMIEAIVELADYHFDMAAKLTEVLERVKAAIEEDDRF